MLPLLDEAFLPQFKELPFGISHQASVDFDALVSMGWEQKYRELMRLGRDFPLLPLDIAKQSQKIEGCESEVRMAAVKDEAGHLWFWGHSEARIITGLIALLLQKVNGAKAADIALMEMESWFQETGLIKHLSQTRGNGLRAIMREIHALAVTIK
ncbi:SufE family protein [Pokkaliibacter sp. CJK22405]|uniref:SufE family protein n=1 Tax=Pokkaliibacter sp. CJK22405 TaxID=3384615 RepID=UPI003984DAAD